MRATIAIVGRPNVGKSTFFNRLTKSRDALVADRPGVTRDRQFGIGRYGDRSFLLIDTGGIGEINPDNTDIAQLVEKQSIQAVEEADVIIWMVDGRDGLTSADEILAKQLRPLNDTIFLAVNKTEGLDKNIINADFFSLGMGEPFAVSAQRGDGIDQLMKELLKTLPNEVETEELSDDGLKISVIGRPNVGKSTLINRIIGEERLVTFDHPGTTRDSIAIDFQRGEQKYILIDTAGVRRRSKVKDHVEKFSVIKSLQSIDLSDIVIMVMDAHEAITDQDITLLGGSHEQGKALIIAVNKWDGIENEQRVLIKNQLERKLGFLQAPTIHFISALHGSGVGKLFNSIDRMGSLLELKKSSAEITKLLEMAVESHQPPLVRGRRIKLRYAHLGGHNPLRIIIHGNQTREVPDSYTRYLANFFQKQLRLEGIPVLIEYKFSSNPFSGRKNELSKRQQAKRQRLMKHVKKKK